MPSGFLPARDAALLAWLQNFATVAAAGPSTIYGISLTQLAAFNTLVTSYQTALAACEPGVRNKAAVFTKNQARKAVATSARFLAKLCEGTSTVTNAQKAMLGLTVRSQPQPVPPPSVQPAVDIVSVIGHTVKIRVHDASGEAKRRKPAGCKGAAIFSYIGATPPTDPTLYKWEGNTTLSQVSVPFPSSLAVGSQVWISASWFNERQQTGPACTPIGAVIQYGMSAVA